MQKTMVRDLTKGNIARLLLVFAFPLFISNALQALYNLVDMVVVGQYIGKCGMSAVSNGGDILHFLTFLAMGFSSAGQVLIAQDVGAGNMDRVRRTIGTMFTFLLICSASLSVIGFLLRGRILVWLSIPAESYDYTMDYMLTCLTGLVFIYGYNIVSAILRGMGDSRRPFVFVAIAAILNTILDIVFVKYLGMEVFGAALATVIGQGVSFVASLIYLYIRRDTFGFDFRTASFVPEKAVLLRLIALGIPMAIQSAAISLSKIVLAAWINANGVIYSALAGVYNKINMIAGIVSNSFTTAGATMVGQNLGAGKHARVPRVLGVIAVCGLVIALLFSGAIYFFSDAIFGIFTGDVSVLEAAGILILPTILNFFGSATRSVAFALINGSGNTRLNLAVALIDGICSRIGIAYLLGFACGMACLGFWLGDAIAGFMPFVIGLVYYLTGRWRSITRIGRA